MSSNDRTSADQTESDLTIHNSNRWRAVMVSSDPVKSEFYATYFSDPKSSIDVIPNVDVIPDSNTLAIVINELDCNVDGYIKANVIGMTQEPRLFSILDKPSMDKVVNKMGTYLIGSTEGLPTPPFKSDFSYVFFHKDAVPSTKTQQMSLMVSDKTHAPGHRYRFELAEYILTHFTPEQLDIHVLGRGCDRLRSKFPNDPRIKGSFDSHTILFRDYRYTIAIENVREPDYFSEKYMDAIRFNCIPLYLGCYNIEKYFGDSHILLTGELQSDMAIITQTYNNGETKDLTFAQKQFEPGGSVHMTTFLDRYIRDNLESSVTCEFNGRLGNQLFELAAAFAYAKKYHKTLYIRPRHTRYGAEYESTLYKSFLKQPRVASKLRQWTEPSFRYHEIPYVSENLEIIGYVQSDLYFKQFATEFINIIRSNSKPIDQTILANLSGPHTVSLHVRRGDYLKTAGFPTQTLDYYVKALSKIAESRKINKIVVFSDDIKWCRKNLTLGSHSIIYVDPSYKLTDEQELLLMSHCQHHIIANSSFSWWGAYLGTGRYTDSITVIPKRWFEPPLNHDWQDIYPKDWIVM